MFCTNSVNSLMGMAVSYFIAVAQFLNVTKSKVRPSRTQKQDEPKFSLHSRTYDCIDTPLT
jgi:hypothetical protein